MSTKRKQFCDEDEEEVECHSTRKSRWDKPAMMITATPIIDDLPNALLMDILVRLPLKSAHQSQCVSHHWRSLISNPLFCCSFVRRQISFNGPPSSLQFTLVSEIPKPCHKEEFRVTGSPGIALSFLPLSPVRVVGSSNDLLLCCSVNYSPESVFYVCNHFTKNWVKLPTLSSPLVHGKMAIGFISEPQYYKVVDDHGRYAIDSSYKYRVVCTDRTCCFKSSDSLMLDIYSSETAQWSKIGVSLSCPYPPLFEFVPAQLNSIAANGRLHWITASHGVFAFNPFTHQYSLLDLPAELKVVNNFHIRNTIRLGECRGQLRILRLTSKYDPKKDKADRDLPPLYLKVWELKDYNAGEWCIVHDCPMDMPESSKDYEYEGYLKKSPTLPLSVAFHPFDGDVVYLWLSTHFIVCNLGSAEFQLFCRFNSGSLYKPTNMVFSLVKPCFPTPVTTRPIHSKTS